MSTTHLYATTPSRFCTSMANVDFTNTSASVQLSTGVHTLTVCGAAGCYFRQTDAAGVEISSANAAGFIPPGVALTFTVSGDDDNYLASIGYAQAGRLVASKR